MFKFGATRFVLPAGILIALAASLAVYAIASLQNNPSVTTDAPFYVPWSTVHVTGSNMDGNTQYDIVTVRPDGTVVSGNAAHNPIPPAPYDRVTSAPNGTFTYDYLLTNMRSGAASSSAR